MPINPNAEIEITAFRWVPQGPRGLVKDLRIRWALEEAGIDYRERLIGMERPSGYLNDQPFNQVPCLRDKSLQMFESGAILQYIGEKSGKLLPRDLQEKYRAIQWVYAALNSIEPFVQHRVLLDSVWAAETWAEPSKPTMDSLARLRLSQLSDCLDDKRWLEGDRFTIGDLMMITVLRIADRGKLLAESSNLQAYLEGGESRPAFQQALSDHLAPFEAFQPEGEAA